MVAWASPNNPLRGPEYELSRLSHWTYQKFEGVVDFMASLPDRFGWQTADGSSCLGWRLASGLRPTNLDKQAGLVSGNQENSYRSRELRVISNVSKVPGLTFLLHKQSIHSHHIRGDRSNSHKHQLLENRPEVTSLPFQMRHMFDHLS